MVKGRIVRITGAASGLGAQDKACGDGPQAFHRSQAWQTLAHHPALDWGRILYPSNDPAESRIAKIAGLCAQLAHEVDQTLAQEQFPLIIGGDHSIAIGTWSGAARARRQPLGLLWIDAHLDAHTPDTSYSGAIHGMPLACLLGRGDKRLLNLGLNGPQLSAEHVVVLGPRSYEPEESAFLARMGVRVMAASEIETRGFPACLDEAMQIVRCARAGFGVSLDLDAIDPHWAPGVGSPEAEGLLASDVLTAVRWIAELPGFTGLEIAEYNPDRDRHGVTARLIADLIAQIVDA